MKINRIFGSLAVGMLALGTVSCEKFLDRPSEDTYTPEILAGLGEMYVADERFRENIDKTGGEGTAAFVSKAIAVYCGK